MGVAFSLSLVKSLIDFLSRVSANILMGSFKHIGLLGGAFNPPHLGHFKMAQIAFEQLHLHEVWMVVSPDHPFKKNELVDFEHRLNMCRLMTKDHDWLVASDVEKQLNTSRTFDTICALEEKNPDTIFTWMMGADALHQFDQWYKWPDLLQRVPMAIFARGGDAVQNAPCMAYIKENHIALQFLDHAPVDIAATQIREHLDDHRDDLHPDVWDYIHKHHLYHT